MICFDIETGALPTEKIIGLMPAFTKTIGPFDPASVKYGNIKDPGKRQEKLEAVKLLHEASIEGLIVEKESYEREWLSKAALDAMTGQVLAIGVKIDFDCLPLIDTQGDPPEEDLLISRFWESAGRWDGPIVGHNIFGFDLPFLIQRSWLLGIDVPEWIRQGRYWSPKFIDTMTVWNMGQPGKYTKLDLICRALGVEGKMEGVNGGDFASLLVTDRAKAIEYLSMDLAATWAVANALQIV